MPRRKQAEVFTPPPPTPDLAPEAAEEHRVDAMFAEYQKQEMEAKGETVEPDHDWAPEKKEVAHQGHTRRRAMANEAQKAEPENGKVVEEVEAPAEVAEAVVAEQPEPEEPTEIPAENDEYELARSRLIVSGVKPSLLKGLAPESVIGLASAIPNGQSARDNSDPSAHVRVQPPEEFRQAEQAVGTKGWAKGLAKHFDGDVASALEGDVEQRVSPLEARLAALERGINQAVAAGRQQFEGAARQKLGERFPALKDDTLYSRVQPIVQALEATPLFATRPRNSQFFEDLVAASAKAAGLTEVPPGEKARQAVVRREKQAGQPHATGALADGRNRLSKSDRDASFYRAFQLAQAGKTDEMAAVLEGIR